MACLGLVPPLPKGSLTIAMQNGEFSTIEDIMNVSGIGHFHI